MANTAIQNIKILHKRYSTEQWASGLLVRGQTIVPTLAQGEIGLDTTTLEVRIGTNPAAEQLWSQAHVITAEVKKQTLYYHKDGTNSETAKADEQYVLTDIGVVNTTEGKHQLTLTYKNIDLLVTLPDLKVTDGTTNVTDGEVAVVTSITEGQEHEIVSTKATAATKNYVDTRNLTVVDTGSGAFITDIVESNANGEHTLTLSRGDIEVVMPGVANSNSTGTGAATEVIVSATLSEDENGDHKLTTVTKSIPEGTGSKIAGNLEFIDSVKLEGHTLTATSKAVKGDGNVISLTKDTDGSIKIAADTYTKAEIDAAHNDLAKAMRFEGTLQNGGTLPVATTENKGAVYKVAETGSVTVGGKAQNVKIGDLFISDGTTWRYIPAGDESFTDTWRGITVNNSTTTVGDNSIGSGDIDFVGGNAISVSAADNQITISHNDTSSVENLTAAERTYVKALTFDEYGHVTGYDVGTEVDQQLPGLQGSISTGSHSFVSSVIATTDENGHHRISGGTKELIAGTNIRLDVKYDQGQTTGLEIHHGLVTTSESVTTPVTITAGGTDNNFTVVDSLVADGYGHITNVNTKKVTVNVPEDTDTKYDISTTQSSNVAGQTSADINLNASGSGSGTDKINLKVDSSTATPDDGLQVKVSGDTITLTGRATADLLGMIRAAYNLNTTASNQVTDGYIKTYTGTDLTKLYGVNVRTDGKAFVEVPWTDTNTHVVAERTGGAVGADLYAFDTDAYGHVNNVYSVTTIDGNYA